MIEIVGTPSVIDEGCECVRVSFTYEGVDYEYDVPKIEDNHFYLVSDLITIDIATANFKWFIDLDGENLLYGNYYQTFNDGYPFFNDWIYNFGDTFENLTTTPCGCESKWSAVHHPIRWELQRKDALVLEKSVVSGQVSIELVGSIPAGVVLGTFVEYYQPDGAIITGFITNISSNRFRLNSAQTGTVSGGFVLFPNLYRNYYIETAVMDEGTNEITTLRTTTLRGGGAVVDVHSALKTLVDFTAKMYGKYNLKFRECYNFTKQPYSSRTEFYYWSNSAKQIGDIYGSNMREYVGNLYEPAKFLSVFQRPTNFIGFPFSLDYITSGEWTKTLRRVVNGTTNTLITHVSGAINSLSVPDNCTSVLIQYGTLSGLPPVFTLEGVLTETKQIKIKSDCIQNAVCLSWINTLGGHEYWVFGYNQTHGLNTSIGATFEPYISDLATAKSNVFDIERFAQPTITLGATVDIEDIKGLQTILYSVCVEMLVGSTWKSVRPQTGSFIIRESRDTNADIELTIDLPFINIQTR